MKKIIQTDHAPAPVGPYSQAVRVGDFLYCSGMIPIDPKTNEVKKGSVTEQTELIMSNIKAVLAAAGADFSNVFKTMIFLVDMKDFADVNAVYGKAFPNDPPARSCVAVSQLPKGVDVEIEVIAKL